MSGSAVSSTLEELTSILADAGGPERPVLVGHDPDFSDLASQLIGARIEMRKGALARIDLPAGPIRGRRPACAG